MDIGKVVFVVYFESIPHKTDTSGNSEFAEILRYMNEVYRTSQIHGTLSDMA